MVVVDGVDVAALRYLVVDDDESFLDTIEGMLRSFGASSIVKATSGSDAVTKLMATGGQVDCILCDYSMKNGNGLQLLQLIRMGQMKYFRADISFVLVTVASFPEIVKTALDLDVNGYLVKPVGADKLRAAIVKARNRHFILNRMKYAEITVRDIPVTGLAPN